jgi:hypothetical protein
MPLLQGLSSNGPTPGDTEGGRAKAVGIAMGLRDTGRLYSGPNVRRLGAQAPVPGLRDRDAAKPKATVSDSAQNILSNGDFAKDFARESKAINTKRGLTKSQRKAQTGALKTRMAIDSGNLTGDAAEQALDLSRESTRRGLTRSQRTGLASASETLLESATGGMDTDLASDFEQGLLKFFDM